MKKLCLLFILMLLLGCAAAEDADRPLRIMTVSDVHYLSPSLFEGSDIFVPAIARGDGKAIMYSKELLDGLIGEVRHQQPDLFIISGDLTFNGEKQSHEELAAAMRALQDEGIPVVVIPGNHDINIASPIRYLKDSYELTENVTSEEFGAIWQGMTASELTGPGFCGVIKLSSKLWVMLGDYGMYEIYTMPNGFAAPEHLAWVEQVCAEAKNAGARLISVSHQSLIPHTSFSADSFCIWNGESVVSSLTDAGCELNLSGHMHLQHILQLNRMADIATGAWSVSPHRYAIVTCLPDGSLRYEAHAVCPEHMPEGIAESTRSFFRGTTAAKVSAMLTALPLTNDEIDQMTAYCTDVNEAYFAGTLADHPEYLTDPARDLWAEKASDEMFGAYMLNLLSEPIEEALVWESR